MAGEHTLSFIQTVREQERVWLSAKNKKTKYTTEKRLFHHFEAKEQSGSENAGKLLKISGMQTLLLFYWNQCLLGVHGLPCPTINNMTAHGRNYKILF